MKNKFYTFKNDLQGRLKNPEFRRLWKGSEVEYELAGKLIERRLIKKISQRELAQRAKTTQAVISRIESLNANPSLLLLKRLAYALDSHLEIRFL